MSQRRERIAILGGGIGSLTTALELTATPELRARYDVTLYQLGWRLGGKLASGREPERGQRNVEHGLHVWFGFYENAFGLTRRLYDEWKKPEGCPFPTWRDAFSQQSFTPVGTSVAGKRGFLAVTWPTNADEPGDGEVALTPWGVVTEFLNSIKVLIERLLAEAGVPDPTRRNAATEPPSLFSRLATDVAEVSVDLVGGLLTRAIRFAARLDELVDGADEPGEHDDLIGGIDWILGELSETMVGDAGSTPPDQVDAHPIRNAVDVGIAFVRGLLNVDYGIVDDWNLNRIDRLEFRAWLKMNGASPVVVDHWSAVRALYDTIFQYRDGDVTKPDLAAGTAARIMIRIMFTYKGSVLWLVNAGMGETLIGPIYEVLRERGVKFRFFHKLTRVELSPDGNLVSKLHFDRQVDLARSTYEPTFVFKGLVCWPEAPFFDQLVNGAALRASGADLESYWCDWPAAGATTLVNGVDFDRAVLGLDLGSWKRLNADESPCQELLDRKPKVRALAENIPLVPTMAMQLWVSKTLPELGFEHEKPAMVDWAFPCDVWADMSQVLPHEDWQPVPPPRSLHYFCGVMTTELFKKPRAAGAVQESANAIARDDLVRQIERYAPVIWPTFTWADLCAEAGQGAERLEAQYVKANVDPAACCVMAPAGTYQYRLGPEESGVTNLTFTGGWVKTNLTATCVEASVMAGMAAARSISGAPTTIVGEGFMA